jgi:hypothetical protein
MRPNETNEIIELNVGGSQYTTSRTTIMSCPDSMLARMISGLIQTATDSTGRLFIDRDGTLFRHILNYLRDKRLNLPENFSEYAQLRQEADFYRIEAILADIDNVFNTKLTGSTKSFSSTLSLNSVNNHYTSINDANAQNAPSNTTKSLYFTIISKLYQGTLESIIGCVRVLTVLSSLDTNSKRFLNCLMQQPFPMSNQQNQKTLIDSFVCECKFMQEERLICCKPCGFNNASDPLIASLCQNILRLAKRYGITTGYWDDMFYLTFDSTIPNREQLCSILNSRYNSKLVNTCICDRRTSYDDTTHCTLVERWYMPDIQCLKSDQ